MTASTGAAGGQEAAVQHPIVAAIAAQRARHQRTFRITFVVTWLVLIGGAIGLAAVRLASKRNAWEETWPV